VRDLSAEQGRSIGEVVTAAVYVGLEIADDIL
jgi:hypothetical protein